MRRQRQNGEAQAKKKGLRFKQGSSLIEHVVNTMCGGRAGY